MEFEDEEKYLEWLARLDLDVEDTTDKDKFEATLRSEFGITGDYQLAVLWRTNVHVWEDLAPVGIRPVVVEYAWGTELRFGIKGFPGLWGVERMREIRELIAIIRGGE